ncbi:hypothetical protein [Maridesulfovibrio sp.]|uniref:hypothetical protein n=1 Tax=Maridesulfovibrio sp. TaxID=2795000 RepID=UPI003AFF726F
MELTTVFAGFLSGLFTYAITKLYVDPILKFNNVRYQIDSTLHYYENCKFLISEQIVENDALREEGNNRVLEGKKELRKLVGQLRASYRATCRLYKGWLEIREIDPLKASNMLLQFSNTLEPRGINYESEIKKILKIENP